MTKALQARTAPELAVLFRALPGPHPTFLPAPAPAPAPVPQPTPMDPQAPAQQTVPAEDPWYAQWWMIFVAVGITAGTSGNLGFLIPMTAIWLWVIYPSIKGSRQRAAITPPVDRSADVAALPEWKRAKVVDELWANGKIPAIKVYRELTGAGLRDAKEAVEHIQRELEG